MDYNVGFLESGISGKEKQRPVPFEERSNILIIIYLCSKMGSDIGSDSLPLL